VLLPIVGFFVGLALIIKNRAGHGVAVMVLSVAIPVMAFAVAYNGSTSGDDFKFTEPAAVTSTPVQSQAQQDRAYATWLKCVDDKQATGARYVDALDGCRKLAP
jgi:hypothetical protein